MKRVAIALAVLYGAFFGAQSTVQAQTCTQPFVLRQESCPSGISTCTTKGSTLNYQELDLGILNTVNLCNGPGKFTWPATGSAGIFSVTSGGAVSIAVDDDAPDNDSEVPDSITIAGGTLSGTNTVTGTLNLDSGIEGHLIFPTSPTLPALCTIGDSYWDTDADVDGSFYICRATNTWKEVDDDGGAGGGAPTSVTYLTLSTDATLTNERILAAGLGLTATDGGAGSAYTLSFSSSDTLVSNPTYSTEDVVFTKDGTGGGLLWEGVTADTIEGILIWNPTIADRTLTLPDVSGSIISTGDTSTVSATMIANDAITEAKLRVVDSPADEECFTYETTTGDFEWQTCGSGGSAVDPLVTPAFYDEMCTRHTTENVYGDLGWSSYGSNPTSAAIAETNHPCVQGLFTSTTSGNIQSIGLARSSTDDQFRVSDLDRAYFVIKTDSVLTNVEYRMGFMDQVDSTTGGDGFFIEYDSAVGSAWRCVTRQGGTTTATANAGGSVAANTWYQLEIERDASGNHKCYVNGAAAFATHTTNLPTGITNLGIMLQTNDTTGKNLYIDAFRLKMKTLTRY